MNNIGFNPEVVKNSNEFIGSGIPAFIVYEIKPSNILSILSDDFSVNDSRPTTVQLIDRHLDKYKNVWQALS